MNYCLWWIFLSEYLLLWSIPLLLPLKFSTVMSNLVSRAQYEWIFHVCCWLCFCLTPLKPVDFCCRYPGFMLFIWHLEWTFCGAPKVSLYFTGWRFQQLIFFVTLVRLSHNIMWVNQMNYSNDVVSVSKKRWLWLLNPLPLWMEEVVT